MFGFEKRQYRQKVDQIIDPLKWDELGYYEDDQNPYLAIGGENYQGYCVTKHDFLDALNELKNIQFELEEDLYEAGECDEVRELIEKVDKERVDIAERLGIKLIMTT